MSLSNDGFVAFHYRSYGTFCVHLKRLHNPCGGFTHYRNYRAEKTSLEIFQLVFLWGNWQESKQLFFVLCTQVLTLAF